MNQELANLTKEQLEEIVENLRFEYTIEVGMVSLDGFSITYELSQPAYGRTQWCSFEEVKERFEACRAYNKRIIRRLVSIHPEVVQYP